MKKYKFLMLTILWMIVIFIFSSQNGSESSMNNSIVLRILQWAGIDATKTISTETVNFIIRKAAHLTEYFVLGMLLYKTFSTYFYKAVGIFSIAAGFLYACTDEFHQYFVPGRGPAFMDVMIDTAGVILGVMLLWALTHKKLKNKELNI